MAIRALCLAALILTQGCASMRKNNSPTAKTVKYAIAGTAAVASAIGTYAVLEHIKRDSQYVSPPLGFEVMCYVGALFVFPGMEKILGLPIESGPKAGKQP